MDALKISYRLSNYIHQEEINSVMFIERSARPAYLGIRKAWDILFSDQELPSLYFINPRTFKEDKLGEEEILKEFESTYSDLAENKEDEILLVDTCMHSGEMMYSITGLLEEAGYNLKLV